MTNTPRERPETIRLRRGKFSGVGGVENGNSLITAPRAAICAKQFVVLRRIGDIHPAPQDRQRSPLRMRQRPAMRRRVDSPRPAGDNRHPDSRQQRPKSLGLFAAVKRTPPRSDDGDRVQIPRFEVSLDVQHQWRIGNALEHHRIPVIVGTQQRDILAGRPVELRIDGRRRIAQRRRDPRRLARPDPLDLLKEPRRSLTRPLGPAGRIDHPPRQDRPDPIGQCKLKPVPESHTEKSTPHLAPRQRPTPPLADIVMLRYSEASSSAGCHGQVLLPVSQSMIYTDVSS